MMNCKFIQTKVATSSLRNDYTDSSRIRSIISSGILDFLGLCGRTMISSGERSKVAFNSIKHLLLKRWKIFFSHQRRVLAPYSRIQHNYHLHKLVDGKKDLLKFYNLHWCKTLFSLRQQVTCPPYGIQILSFHMMESSYHCNTQEQIYIIHILSNMVNIKQRCWVSSNPYCFIY